MLGIFQKRYTNVAFEKYIQTDQGLNDLSININSLVNVDKKIQGLVSPINCDDDVYHFDNGIYSAYSLPSIVFDTKVRGLTTDEWHSLYRIDRYLNHSRTTIYIPIVSSNVFRKLKVEKIRPKLEMYIDPNNGNPKIKNIAKDVDTNSVSRKILELDISTKEYSITDIDNDVEVGNFYYLGLYNFVLNKVLYFNDGLDVDKLTKQIMSSQIYKKAQKLKIKSSGIFTTGTEQEFLFPDPKDKIIPAYRVIFNYISDVLNVREENKSEVLEMGRDAVNKLLKHTGIGVDGRRIIGELRSNIYQVDIRNRQNINSVVDKIIAEVGCQYQKLKEMRSSILIGGGDEGETIGSHIHFNLKMSPEYVKVLNTFIAKPLQEMHGGKRPEMINPNDTFTTNRNDRRPNEYGKINNDNPLGNDQVRTKNYGGWEYRPSPAFYINPTFSKNLLLSVYEILHRDYNEIKTPNSSLILSKTNIHDIYSEFDFLPFIEFYLMTKTLSLTENPFLYFLKERHKAILSRLEIMNCSNKIGNFDLNKIKLDVKDYIHRNVIIKLVTGKINYLKIPRNFSEASLLANLYNLDIKIKPSVNNTCIIGGNNLTEKQITNIIKICLLTV